MKITNNFDREEFDCKDGTPYPECWIRDRLFKLCLALEKIRALTNKKMTIVSGYRTMNWNKKVKGKPHSMHLEGLAADFKLEGMPLKRVYSEVDRMQKDGLIPKGGLAIYPTFIHVDVEGSKLRRW